MIRQFAKMLAPLSRRVSMMVARGRLGLLDDGPSIQITQVDLLADETIGGVERFQNYGMTSRPKPGAEGIMVAVAGTRSQGVLVVVDDRRFRFRLEAEGEVALYDDQGQVVWLKRDGIEITSPFKVTVTAPQVRVETQSAVLVSDNIQLGAEGGKKVALDGDPVVAGKVVASSTKVKAT